MRTMKILGIIATNLLVASPACAMDQDTLQDMNAELVAMWVLSEQCKDVIGNVSETYSRPIHDYLKTLYPSGVPYWVLPNIKDRESNSSNCVYKLQTRLFSYNFSVKKFREKNNGEPSPPYLSALPHRLQF